MQIVDSLFLFSRSWNSPHVAGNADQAGSKQPADSQSRTDPAGATSQQLSSHLYIHQKLQHLLTLSQLSYATTLCVLKDVLSTSVLVQRRMQVFFIWVLMPLMEMSAKQ